MGIPRTTIHPVSEAAKQAECGCGATLYSACFQIPAAPRPGHWPMCGECSGQASRYALTRLSDRRKQGDEPDSYWGGPPEFKGALLPFIGPEGIQKGQ